MEKFDSQRTGQELEEDLDFNKLKPCPHCKKPIPQNATLCLYCGESVNFSTKKPYWVIWTAAIMAALFIAFALKFF